LSKKDFEFEYVKAIFLPPNVTFHTQPLDVGAIRNFKAFYKGYFGSSLFYAFL